MMSRVDRLCLLSRLTSFLFQSIGILLQSQFFIPGRHNKETGSKTTVTFSELSHTVQLILRKCELFVCTVNAFLLNDIWICKDIVYSGKCSIRKILPFVAALQHCRIGVIFLTIILNVLNAPGDHVYKS